MKSQNGWPLLTSKNPLLVAFAPVSGKVRAGDVANLFAWLAARFSALVEPIDRSQSWGWAYRLIRGALKWSNHASGTAVDFNSARHPLGKVGTFSVAQRGRIRAIIAETGGVLRWGGDYSGRKDEMHFEVNLGIGPERVALAAWRLCGVVARPDGTQPVLKASTAAKWAVWVIYLQSLLNRLGYGTTVDGDPGPQTFGHLHAFQKAHWPADPRQWDSVAGPRSWAALETAAAHLTATPTN